MLIEWKLDTVETWKIVEIIVKYKRNLKRLKKEIVNPQELDRKAIEEARKH